MELVGYLILYFLLVLVVVTIVVTVVILLMLHMSTPYEDLPAEIDNRKPDSVFNDKEHFLKAVTKLEEANSNSSSIVSSSSKRSTGLIGETFTGHMKTIWV